MIDYKMIAPARADAISESNNFIVLGRINKAILKIRFYYHKWDKNENYD
jgi:hypothetical protein